jgi:hypothetical protein
MLLDLEIIWNERFESQELSERDAGGLELRQEQPDSMPKMKT